MHDYRVFETDQFARDLKRNTYSWADEVGSSRMLNQAVKVARAKPRGHKTLKLLEPVPDKEKFLDPSHLRSARLSCDRSPEKAPTSPKLALQAPDDW